MLEKMARDVAETLPQDKYQFDPTIILLIIEVLQELLPVVIDWCKNRAEDVVAMAKEPTLLQRMVVKRRVRRALGRKEFREVGNDVVNGIFAVGADADPADIETAYNEAVLT